MEQRNIDTTIVSDIVRQHDARPELLVQILQSIVARCGWVAEDTIRQLADELNLSRADVYGVVNFYHDFRTEPPGKHIVKICQAEACQAMGSRELTAFASSRLGAHLHGTHDGVTLEPVYCLGNCACAPAVMVNGKTHGRVDQARFEELLGTVQEHS